MAGPLWQQTEDVAQVGPGLDVVKAAACEQQTKVVLASAPSSLPTKSQFLRPTAWRRSCSSLMLLWIGSRPSVRNRDRPSR